MYVIAEADGKIYRIYATIGQCWRSSLIVPRRSAWTYWEFYRTVQRGEVAACPSFFVRKCNGTADIKNFEKTKSEWDAAVEAARIAEASRRKSGE